MRLRKQKRAHPVLTFAVLAFVVVGTALPIVIGGSGQKVTIESAGLQAATPDTYQIATPLRLPAAPQVKIERGVLILMHGHATRPNSAEAALQLLASGAARLTLKDAVVTIDPGVPTPQAPATTDHSEISDEAAPIVATLLRLNFESIALRDSEIKFRRADGTAAVLNDVSAEIVHKRKSSLAAKGTFGVLGQRLSFDATLGLPAAGKAPARYPLKASVKGALVEGQIDGRFTNGETFSVQGQAALAVTSLRYAARWLGNPWPQGPGLDDFRARGQLDWSSRGFAFQKANLQMDGNEATGTVSFSFGGTRPSVEGTLAFNTLDLSRHLKGDQASRSVADVLQRAAGHDGTDLSMPLVQHLDADIRISANRVRLGAIDLGRSALTLSLKSGKLLADIAEFEHEGGRGSGQVSVDTNRDLPRVTVRGKLSAFDLGRLANAAAGQQVLTGRGDMTIDLAANGETVTQIVRTLEGKAGIEVNDGARLGIDLNTLMMAPQRRSLDGWRFATRGQTPIEQLRGRFVASHGSVTVEMLEATTADSIISLTGSANLSQRTIEAALHSARKLASDANQTEPVSVRGPWASPLFRSAEAQRKAAESTSGAAGQDNP